MTTAAEFLAQTTEPPPERDRWGRYLVLDPETGKKVAYQRVTTFAKILADTYNLERWSQRMVAKGLANRPDLLAQVASVPVEDRDTLNRIAEEAKEAAGASVGRNLGTASHAFTERIDRGEANVVAPPPLDRDLDAYRAALVDAGIVAVPEWIERVVIVPELGVAGTFDRILRGPWQLPYRIGDVKTAQEMYGWLEIAIQLACYAHASSIYNLRTQTHEPMPEIDRDLAIVMHLPAGKATCTLYEVDIAAGWEMAQIAAEVRGFRKRKNLAAVLTVAEASATVDGTPAESGEAGAGLVLAPAPAPRALGLVASGLARRIQAATAEQQERMAELQAAAGLPRLSECPTERLGEWSKIVNEVCGDKLGRYHADIRDDLARRVGLLTDEQAAALGVLLASKGMAGLSATDDDRLDEWASCLIEAEAKSLPFTPGVDEVFAGLPAADGGFHQHPDLEARYAALPADIAARVDLERGDIPNLRFHEGTPEQVARATALIAAGEAAWEARKGYIASLLQGLDDELVDAIATTVGCALAELTDLQVEVLEELCQALDAGLLGLGYDADTVLLVTSDRALAVVTEVHGSKQAALAAAKEAAKAAGLPSPRSVAQAAEHPLLVARLSRRAS